MASSPPSISEGRCLAAGGGGQPPNQRPKSSLERLSVRSITSRPWARSSDDCIQLVSGTSGTASLRGSSTRDSPDVESTYSPCGAAALTRHTRLGVAPCFDMEPPYCASPRKPEVCGLHERPSRRFTAGYGRGAAIMAPPRRCLSYVSSAPASLNPAQLQAVHHLEGPCLVLAGAGSGKTRVITHKIARLLQAGYAPGQIAAITFTNKAAAEMRERARHLVGAKAAQPLVVSTFHSLGVRILRSDGERVGLKPQFSILDSDDVLAILKDAGGSTDNALARRWQWAISLWKNQGLAGEQAEGAAANDDERVAARVMKRYE